MSYNEGQFDYSDRYGTKSSRIWIKYASIFTLVGGAWIIWAGLHHSNPELRTQLISFVTDDPRAPEIRYSIQRKSGSDVVVCTLTARDYDKNIVGQIEETIPAGESYIELTTAIPTRADAVNAGIERCLIAP
jgi:hypothetical protein